MKKLTILLLVLCFSSLGFSLDLYDSGYTAETYVTYSGSNVDIPHDMTFDDNHNLYITQRGDNGIIWKVDSTASSVSSLVTGLDSPRGIDWGGGTDYEDYLYVNLAGDADKVIKVSTSGSYSNFTSIYDSPAPLEIDKEGNYNERLYSGTTGYDSLYEVTTGGSSSVFSSFPGDVSDGGYFAINFDPGSDYGGSMYVGTAYSGGTPPAEGLFAMDISGNATRFSDDVTHVWGIEFDPFSDFHDDMFVNCILSGVSGRGIYRVQPDETASLFADSMYTMRAYAFGNDGAMYVSEFIDATDTVIISKITPIPEPASFCLLGLGSFFLLRKRKSL